MRSDGPEVPLGLRVAWHDAVVVVTIDRDEVLNALDSPLRVALAACLRDLARNPSARALVLTGAGQRAFTVGQDLREAEHLDAGSGRAWMATWVDLYEAIAGLPMPTVAALNGVAAGAGFQLGLLCDLRVASSTARFGLREVDVGLPAVTGFWLLAAMLGRSRATELVLSGRLMAADEALAQGLVHRVAEASDVLSQAIALAAGLASQPPLAMRATRGRLLEVTLPALREASQAAARYQVAAVETGVPQVLMSGFLARARQRRLARDGEGGMAHG
jgi:enoyl-CoA hydratase